MESPLRAVLVNSRREMSKVDHFLAIAGTEAIWFSHVDNLIAFVSDDVNSVDMLSILNTHIDGGGGIPPLPQAL